MYYNNETPKPPKLALRLLKWFCTEQWLEEIEGDLQEEFSLNVESIGLKQARRVYSWTVLKSFRAYLFIDKIKSHKTLSVILR